MPTRSDEGRAGPPVTPAERSGAEGGQPRRTRLKIFLGFAPGVGKTYRMLQVARDLAAEGVDVVVGAVETHGHYDTAGLLLGLEVLPRRQLPSGDRVVEELDLDSALARRPRIVLLDDLAHANAPGSRHAKRWQDALELLEAGVEVYATLNVQHVESLVDVVAQITRVEVRGTVPDAILERADEIELVDIAPEALLERLREGKVHLPDGAAPGAEGLFRRGSLLALRELALRRMAERVDADVLAYRQAQGVDVPWPTAERILVCVGPAPGSARLVRAARRIAAGLRAPWVAASVEVTGRAPRGQEDRARVEEHLRLAESLGAEAVRLTGASVANAVLADARKRNVTRIVLGKPRHARWRDRVRGSLVDELIRGSGDIEVTVLSAAVEPAVERDGPRPRPEPLAGHLRALVIVALSTAVAAAARALLGIPDVVMLFLLGVTIVAVTSGRGPSIVAAALSVGAYDFFFVPPPFTLSVADARYLLTFGMMFGVGIVISTLAVRLREQGRAAVVREERTSALYALSRQLGSAVDARAVAGVCVRAAAEVLDSEAVLLAPEAGGALAPLAAFPQGAALAPAELEVARWTLHHASAAGRGTGTFAEQGVVCAPLRVVVDALAVLAVRLPSSRSLDADQRDFMDALCRHAALALERVRLADEARRAALRAETEALRSRLLSAVSHDLRTPLAAITGAATTLREERGLDEETRRDLAETACEEAERLERLVSNLLDMTRLDSGAVEPRREWVPLVEIVGSALTRLERRLAGRPVKIAVADDLPLLSVDPVLLEQLFLNLLENATKYTPAGSQLDVVASREGGTLVIDVADRGPGIPAGAEEQVFERFHRGAHPGVGGVGLGLPIARAIAQAHGGRLVAANRPGGGALFRLSLPLAPVPPPAEPEAEQETA